MSRFAVVFVALALAALCAAAPEGETYNTRYDNVNLEGLLADPEKVDGAITCFLADDETDCSEMAGRIKAVLPEALPQNCAKCSDAQKAGLAKTVKFLAAKRSEQWSQLKNKFDPENLYAQAHPELF